MLRKQVNLIQESVVSASCLPEINIIYVPAFWIFKRLVTQVIRKYFM